MDDLEVKYKALSFLAGNELVSQAERAVQLAKKFTKPNFPFEDALESVLISISKNPKFPDLDVRKLLTNYCDLAFEGFSVTKRHRHEGSATNRKRREDLARSRGNHTEEEWDLLVEFCEWRCVRCGVDIRESRMTKDHVVPLVFEGLATDHITNLQPLCLSCNSWKACKAVDFVSFEIRERIFWEYGFLWFDDKSGKQSLQISKQEYDYHCKHEGPYKTRKHWEIVYQ